MWSHYHGNNDQDTTARTPARQDATTCTDTSPTPPGPGWRHTGTCGRLGTLSFNGNKIITTGGGGRAAGAAGLRPAR